MGNDNRKLQQEWAKRLKRSGFDDIELPDGSLRHGLRTTERSIPASYTLVAFEARRRYYEVAYHLVEEERRYYELRDSRPPPALRVRALHADGASRRDIHRITKVSEHRIRQIIKEFSSLIKEEILK